MKYIKTFESFKINEELLELGLLALAGGLYFAGGQLYDKAKQLWSKHITSEKYTKTGKKQEVQTKLFQLDNPVDKAKTELLEEYKDSEGNLYWGYDHFFIPEDTLDPLAPHAPETSRDIYTAIFDEKDLPRLIKYLQGIKVDIDYDWGGLVKATKNVLDKPKAVDMIYRRKMSFDELEKNRKNMEDFYRKEAEVNLPKDGDNNLPDIPHYN